MITIIIQSRIVYRTWRLPTLYRTPRKDNWEGERESFGSQGGRGRRRARDRFSPAGDRRAAAGAGPGQSQSQIIHLAIGCYIRWLNITECLAQFKSHFWRALLQASSDGRVVVTRGATRRSSSLKYILLNPASHFSDVVRECRHEQIVRSYSFLNEF